MPATLVTSDPATGLRRGPIRWPHGTIPTPFGCRRCGYPESHHGLGAHQWERPTNAQMLARMRTRRVARLLKPIPLPADLRTMVTLSAGASNVAQIMLAAIDKLTAAGPPCIPDHSGGGWCPGCAYGPTES